MNDAVTVDTVAGTVVGRIGDDGIRRFAGVPYAEAARFAPPGPPAAWTGARSAVAPGPAAPQTPTMLDRMLTGEDLPVAEAGCLTANVWTPGCDGARRPVLVWIHGGAFATGTGRSPWYDGARLAARGDVVVVTANYRLGVLGFLHGVAPDAANLGLLDQAALLRWVRDHAAAFGGDPGNVTVFGESAGGASVAALLAAPATEGLFHRAVAQSASLTQLRSAARAAEATAELYGHLGLSTEDPEAAARLAALPMADVLAAQQRLLADPRRAITATSPTADGVTLPASVEELADAAARRDVPLLIGTTRDEMALFSAFDPNHASLDEALLRTIATRSFGAGAGADEALAAYRAERPLAAPPALATAIATDATFRIPAVRLAERRAAAGTATWLYWFTWATPAFGGVLGSCHGIEIPFVFHNLGQPGVDLFLGTGAEREAVADAAADTWLTFARSGRCGWATYTPADRQVLRLDVEPHVVADPEGASRACWDGVDVWP